MHHVIGAEMVDVYVELRPNGVHSAAANVGAISYVFGCG